MRFYSTRSATHLRDSDSAILGSTTEDGGLYFPERYPSLDWFESVVQPIAELGKLFLFPFFEDSFSRAELDLMLERALYFPAPLRKLRDDLYVLELFHGPTLAFKDFGAQVMSECMCALALRQGREVTVLAATSGDTGAAVARAFHKRPGARVAILFPKGRISPLQELQMTTLGHNVSAIEVDGNFDDCQALVKQAFADQALSARCNLVSANSINICRLLPQSLYYLSALQQLGTSAAPTFVTPSGNFGNLFAGMLLRFMGLPELKFVAATNSNRTFIDFLESANYQPRASIRTYSNAMDVGAPSNLERIRTMVSNDLETLRSFCWGVSITDAETIETMKRVYGEFGYAACPHTAVGLEAARLYQSVKGAKGPVVCLATAHPAKFLEVTQLAGLPIEIPQALSSLTCLPVAKQALIGGKQELQDMLVGLQTS